MGATESMDILLDTIDSDIRLKPRIEECLSSLKNDYHEIDSLIERFNNIAEELSTAFTDDITTAKSLIGRTNKLAWDLESLSFRIGSVYDEIDIILSEAERSKRE